MHDDINPRTRAIGALAEMFFEQVSSATDLYEFERHVIELGHDCMAKAMGLALETLDDQLLARKPRDLKAHDIRHRTLATEFGDVGFDIRRYRDRAGRDVYLLADALDISYGSRVSPSAAEFLIEAGAMLSYAKSTALLARNGSTVRPTTVMRCLREAGRLCAEEDEHAAASLYRDGVIPEGAEKCEELCAEADGTYFSTQRCPEGTPARLELKALVAYSGKETRGGKVARRGCVHHALVGSPAEIWTQGVCAIGGKYDLSAVKRVHLGADGERWCREGGRYFPFAHTTYHLDPFHVNHAIMGCVPDTDMAWNVIDVLNDGDKAEAIALLKSCRDFGLTKGNRVDDIIKYIEGNLDHIAVDGPSLGTMESENQHLYGSRMDCWPCAWSLQGASDMGRIISRRASKREIPRMTRERSMGKKRCGKRKRKEMLFYESQGSPGGKVPKSVGRGYLPPHQVDTRRMNSGKRYALLEGMAILDRGI